MDTSRIFVTKLRELGFVRYTPIEFPDPDVVEHGELLNDEPDDQPTGHRRPALLPEGTPMFIALSGDGGELDIQLTLAWDELGDQWIKMGQAVDLRIYGFVNPLEKVTFN